MTMSGVADVAREGYAQDGIWGGFAAGLGQIANVFVSVVHECTVAALYTPLASAGAYGFGATLPDDASSLLLLAGNVENLLRTRPLTEPPKNKSLKVDPILAADDVRDAADALRTALEGVEREKREAQLTLGAKNDAMNAWGAAYPAVADGAAAFFALGGRADLAQRVRPTARRRVGLPDEETTNPTPTPAGNTGGSPA